jgi:hypothetical protein
MVAACFVTCTHLHDLMRDLMLARRSPFDRMLDNALAYRCPVQIFQKSGNGGTSTSFHRRVPSITFGFTNGRFVGNDFFESQRSTEIPQFGFPIFSISAGVMGETYEVRSS